MPTATPTTSRADRRADRHRQRFAKLWRSMDDAVHEQVLPAKRAVLQELPSEIVEIGPGCGSNFGHYPRGARVVAFEPNPFFDDDLRATADEHGHELELRRDMLTDRLPAASADVVVSTLVLCSVPDPSAMLDEIWRVLRPGGRLLFIEHVVAPQRGLRRAYQRLLRRPWRWIGDGCDTCARTADHLEASPFELRDTGLRTLGSNLDPTNLTMWGTAVRPDRGHSTEASQPRTAAAATPTAREAQITPSSARDMPSRATQSP